MPKLTSTTSNIINTKKIKKLYLDGCRSYSLKPKKQNFDNLVKLLEGDAVYWMGANLKYFFERMNH